METANDRKPVMLIDYCHRTVATVGGDRYKEVVLYKNSGGSAELHFYEKRQSETKEAHMAYAVDKAVIEEAYALITKNRASTWSKKKILGNVGAVTGAVNILKFRN